jgi:hypothetical protein
MRKPASAVLAARKPRSPRLGDAPAHWVCLALLLALVVLAGRIASIL